MIRFLSMLVAALCMSHTAYSQNYQGECMPNYEAYARSIFYLTAKNEAGTFSGTATWLTPTKALTINHVASAALQENVWTNAIIRRGGVPYEPYHPYQEKEIQEGTTEVRARLLKIFSPVEDEAMAVVEFDRPVGKGYLMLRLPAADRIWKSPRLGDPVFGVTLVGNGPWWPELRYAGGHVFKDFFPEESRKNPRKLSQGFLWLEMVTRPLPYHRSRAVSNSGSSGFPIFDCNGILVGVVAKQLTQNVGGLVLPTAWGIPNLMALYLEQKMAIELRKMQKE